MAEVSSDAAAATTLVVEPPGALFEKDWEEWDAYYMGDQPVGYMHLQARRVGDGATSTVRYRLENRLIIGRGSSSVTQRFIQTSTETVDGRLLDFESVLHVGPATSHFDGAVKGDRLKVNSRRGSEQSTIELPWKTTYRGLIAIEQSMRRNPMKEGESRALRMPMLLPGGYEIVTARLRSIGSASVPMLNGEPRTLLEVSSEVSTGTPTSGQLIESILWSDPLGRVLRTYSPEIRMVAFHSDRKRATTGQEQWDRATRSLSFEVEGEITMSASDMQRVAFEMSPTAAVKKAGATIAIDPAPGQYVRRTEDGSIQILVSHGDQSKFKGFESSDLVPGDGDRKANRWIDSDSPLIARIVNISLAGSKLEPREAALELTRSAQSMFAHQTDFFPGLGRASEMGEKGDSTQQAIVLAALLRASKIPSRLASGLVYVAGQPTRMSYHTWTLAYVDDAWLALDATTGGLAAPDRLTFGTTDLSEGTEYDSIDPILANLGRIDIKIVGTR